MHPKSSGSLKKPAAIISEISPISVGFDFLAKSPLANRDDSALGGPPQSFNSSDERNDFIVRPFDRDFAAAQSSSTIALAILDLLQSLFQTRIIYESRRSKVQTQNDSDIAATYGEFAHLDKISALNCIYSSAWYVS